MRSDDLAPGLTVWIDGRRPAVVLSRRPHSLAHACEEVSSWQRGGALVWPSEPVLTRHGRRWQEPAVVALRKLSTVPA